MQSAFCFFLSGPTSCTRIFTWHNFARALLAANARIVLIMQRIINNIILTDVIPYIFRCPVSDWIEFYKSEFCIVLNFFGICARRGLIAANTGNPSLIFGQNISQRLYFADVAACVRIGFPQLFAKLRACSSGVISGFTSTKGIPG